MSRKRIMHAIGAAVLVLLQACGSRSESVATRPMSARPPAHAQMPQPEAAQPRAGQGDPRPLLANVAVAYQAAQGFSALIETYDKGPTGSGQQTLQVAFKKPSSLAITMLKNTGGNEGTMAVWSGGSNIKVKPKFPPITLSLALDDERIKSYNGWTLKDTEVSAMLRVLLDPNAQVRLLGIQQLNGKLLTMLEVKSRLSPKGATHEVIGIDPQTRLPGIRNVYQSQKLLYKLEIKRMQLTVPSAREFSL